MKRRLFNLAAAVSLVLCVATAVQWVGREAHAPVVIFAVHPESAPWRGVAVRSSPEGVRFGYQRQEGSVIFASGLQGSWTKIEKDSLPRYYEAVESLSDHRMLGFRWFCDSSIMKAPVFRAEQVYWLIVPYWFLLLATGIAPAWWLRKALRRRIRWRHGLCPECGYDLRATPERCPECGAVPAHAAGRRGSAED